MQFFTISRRGFNSGLAAMGAAIVSGCGQRAGGSATTPSETTPSETTGAKPNLRPAMIVYRDPSCGCCEAWAAIAQEAGFSVTVIDHPDMSAIKMQHRVPAELSSCHTAIVGGYAIEGHVPIDHVGRLLDTRPAEIRGLAVPGMPRGSPGMEMPDGSMDAFDVLAFDNAGRSTRFSL